MAFQPVVATRFVIGFGAVGFICHAPVEVREVPGEREGVLEPIPPGGEVLRAGDGGKAPRVRLAPACRGVGAVASIGIIDLGHRALAQDPLVIRMVVLPAHVGCGIFVERGQAQRAGRGGRRIGLSRRENHGRKAAFLHATVVVGPPRLVVGGRVPGGCQELDIDRAPAGRADVEIEIRERERRVLHVPRDERRPRAQRNFERQAFLLELQIAKWKRGGRADRIHPADPREHVLELVPLDRRRAVAVLDLQQNEPRVFVLGLHPEHEEKRLLRVVRVSRTGEERPVVEEAPVRGSAVLANFKSARADASEGHSGSRKLGAVHSGFHQGGFPLRGLKVRDRARTAFPRSAARANRPLQLPRPRRRAGVTAGQESSGGSVFGGTREIPCRRRRPRA